MAQSFPGFKAPAAGFDEPVEMLASCHDRLRDRCSTLSRLPAHIAEHGADEQARNAAQSILRYFDGPAMYHHADEEKDLFPALLESVAGSDAVCLRELFEKLSTEHRRLESQWQRLRGPLLLVSEGQDATLPQQDIEAFIDGYASHLQCEDDELLPMARRMLDDASLKQLGTAMQLRRNPA